MNQLISLIWKEWRETRPYLWIGLSLFLGLPIIGGFEEMAGNAVHFHLITTPWVTYAGGLLAIFTAVGSTCRDLNSRLEDFWRSRPVSAARWILIKYAVGLAIVLAACLTPLLAERTLDPSNEVTDVIAFYPFHWIAVYSLAFVAGCLLRRAAHAAVLGVAAMLLILFLPILLPPLAWMNLSRITPDAVHPLWGISQIYYAAGMLGIAIFAAITAIFTVRFSWHIEAGIKIMYGSFAAAFLILCASAAFQVGTGLPVLQQIPLPDHAIIEYLYFGQKSGDLFCRCTDGKVWQRRHYDVELGPSGITLTHPTLTEDTMWWQSPHATLPDGTGVWYQIGDSDFHNGPVKLMAIQQTTDHHPLPIIQLPLQIWTGKDNGERRRVYIARGNRLFVIEGRWHVATSRISVLDISTPLNPRLISDQTYDDRQRPYTLDTDQLDFLFHPISDLSPHDRLEMELQFQGISPFDGETLCINSDSGINIYRLTNLTDRSARFKKVDNAQKTILDRVFGDPHQGYGPLQLTNGLLYAGHDFGHYLFPSVVIYDAHSKDPGKIIGHFAAPKINAVCPLPDGRALIGGDHLWLVGPPPKAEAN